MGENRKKNRKRSKNRRKIKRNGLQIKLVGRKVIEFRDSQKRSIMLKDLKLGDLVEIYFTVGYPAPIKRVVSKIDGDLIHFSLPSTGKDELIRAEKLAKSANLPIWGVDKVPNEKFDRIFSISTGKCIDHDHLGVRLISKKNTDQSCKNN